MDEFANQTQPAKRFLWWVWLIVIIILLIIVGGGIWLWQKSSKLASTPTSTPTPSATQQIETWTKGDRRIMNGVTSSDTHKLADGTYRMYFMQNSGIAYAESSDALNFDAPKPTGVTQEPGKMISNPAVLKIEDSNWIMIYEQQPQKQTNSNDKTTPGPDIQRNLYLASSTDGKNFTKVGLAIDSSKEDNYFASVPDLVLLPDGKIKMYYVSGGQAIGSATSVDKGSTWQRDSGYRLEDNAVDPDVLLKTENDKNYWIMYYTILSGSGNALYKATSSNGINWTKVSKVLDAKDKTSVIVDADVVPLTQGKYRMFFGEVESEESGAPGAINLYYADSSGDIFSS
jgi:hypothetical protein